MDAKVRDIALAYRADFELADATVRPSIRTVEGPTCSVTLEPKVMRVLIAFAESGDAVLTRDDLVRDCWGGRVVGDDAVNRAVTVLRRAVRDSGADFRIETIPRIGFRLVRGRDQEDENGPNKALSSRSRLSRRVMISTLAAGVTAVSVGAFWRQIGSRSDSSEVSVLIERGRRALHDNYPDSGSDAITHLLPALELDARNAEAWGLLSFAYRDIAEGAAASDVSRNIRASEEAAQRALERDPRQGDALAALATLQPYFGDYSSGEDRLMGVLGVDPGNFLAMLHLIPLYQGVGRVRVSAEWNDRLGEADPRSPVSHYRRGLKLWGLGEIDGAEQAMERAIQLWPRHPSVWNARMMLFAFTNRVDAAFALLDDKASRPVTLKAPAIDLWRISLVALQSRRPADIAAARSANLSAAPRSPGFANIAMHSLAMLGEIDAAFDIAFGYYLRRGPLIAAMWEGAGELPVSALRWRRSMALFVPPAAPMRADRRFAVLMDGMGITQYWRKRGVGPDPQLGLGWLTAAL